MGETAVEIRPYRDADFEALTGLWKACGMVMWYNDPARDIALWQATESAEILVAEENGALIGGICVGHDGHRGWVYYLAVDPERRKEGIARRLVAEAEAWLIARDVPKVQLLVRHTNTAANGFYEAIGYEPNPCKIWQRWLIDRGEPPAGEMDVGGLLEVTITYLEMTSRPSMPPPPPPANLRLALLHAERPTVSFYRFLYNTVGKDWTWYERRMMSDEHLAAIVQHDAVEVYVAYDAGVPCGYFEFDGREAPTWDLAFFGLMPEYVGMGLGPYLLHQAVQMIWDKGPERVRVNTCSLDHPKALSVYQKIGFSPVRRETKMINDPVEAGIVPAS